MEVTLEVEGISPENEGLAEIEAVEVDMKKEVQVMEKDAEGLGENGAEEDIKEEVPGVEVGQQVEVVVETLDRLVKVEQEELLRDSVDVTIHVVDMAITPMAVTL